jgi:hypothetical protein
LLALTTGADIFFFSMAATELVQIDKKNKNMVTVQLADGESLRIDWFSVFTMCSIAQTLKMDLIREGAIVVDSPPLKLSAHYTRYQQLNILLKVIDWLLIAWTIGVYPVQLEISDIKVYVPPGRSSGIGATEIRVIIAPKYGYKPRCYSMLPDTWRDTIYPLIEAFNCMIIYERANLSMDLRIVMNVLVQELNREMISLGDRVNSNYIMSFKNPLIEPEPSPRGLTIDQLVNYITSNIRTNASRTLFVISMMHYVGEPEALHGHNVVVSELEALYNSHNSDVAIHGMKHIELLIDRYSRRLWYIRSQEDSTNLLLLYLYKYSPRVESQEYFNTMMRLMSIE